MMGSNNLGQISYFYAYVQNERKCYYPFLYDQRVYNYVRGVFPNVF